jgi:D-sedoheptulose 7-phosphate isomerase
MNTKGLIREQLDESRSVLEKFLNDPAMIDKIETAALTIANAVSKGNKIITCGNGGSHCDAMHFAEEMTGKFRDERRPLPAIAISDPSHMSCVGNDYGFSKIFSRFVEGIGKSGDILLVLSTSGNSENILEAASAAHTMGMVVIALSGKDGGRLAEIADQSIIVPHFGFSDRIQEIHIKIIHILIYLIEKLVK